MVDYVVQIRPKGELSVSIRNQSMFNIKGDIASLLHRRFRGEPEKRDSGSVFTARFGAYLAGLPKSHYAVEFPEFVETGESLDVLINSDESEMSTKYNQRVSLQILFQSILSITRSYPVIAQLKVTYTMGLDDYNPEGQDIVRRVDNEILRGL